jgi:hypothetical protein
MRTQRHTPGLLAALIAMSTTAQTPYPEYLIQDAAWTSGTHHYAVSNRILSSGATSLPVDISGTADAEFVSATSVRLAPGFHAGGFSGGGRFRARIDDGLGAAELIVIHPDPGSSLVDNVLQVPKWEKLELGLRLPQEYQDAVDRFFAHYYSLGMDSTATPMYVDSLHDLNPYADDSLQLVLTLNDPDNTTRLKWGFYMKEGKWSSELDNAVLVLDPDNPLHPYGVRFRLAPDKEGPWQFTLSLKAPYTSDLANTQMTDLLSTGYSFVCTPRLEDNKGPLSVNHANGRSLKTATGEHFMALGTNIGAERGGPSTPLVPAFFYKFGIDQVKNSMSMLHDVGGNFMRIWLTDKVFSPEWVNLGVYDAYQVPRMCIWDDNPSSPCNNQGQWHNRLGNGQLQALAFDEVLDHARETNIYFQVCVDPYPGIVAYERGGWGANPYIRKFVKPYLFAQDNPNNNPYNIRRFYYQDGDTTNSSEGPFYFWKRRYKYMLNRWGYAPHFAIIEPFQETGQILSYNNDSLFHNSPVPCHIANTDSARRDMCRESKGPWVADPELPDVLAHWLQDMITHVRGDVDPGNPSSSPLGEDKKLFLLSGGGGPWLGDPNADQAEIDRYNRPFTIPELDLIDAHVGFFNNYLTDKGKPDSRSHQGFEEAQLFWNRFPTANATAAQRKPFNHGEYTHYTGYQIDPPGWTLDWKDDIEKIFHNYNVSFHNELWTSAFSGKFAAGTSWIWERVFWWPGSMPKPPLDNLNLFQGDRLIERGDTNTLGFNVSPRIKIVNWPVHHHIKPLSDILSHPSWLELNFFDNELVLEAIFDSAEADPNLIECYYQRTQVGDIAIGWVHNRKASSMSNFYIKNSATEQNYFGCTTPSDTAVLVSGFIPDTEYHITWFPTWANSTACPMDTVRISDPIGQLLLDLSTAPLGDTMQYYTDTLHSDYAFIITLEDFVKSRTIAETGVEDIEWDFSLYPNPTRQFVRIRFTDDSSKEIALFDIAGRCVHFRDGITSHTLQLEVKELSMGPYFVRVFNGVESRTKKLIIH